MTAYEYNADELHPPSWLSEEFFKNVFVKCENDNTVKLTKLTIVPGTTKGDHYASVLFRATVTYESAKSKGASRSLIIKTMPEIDGQKKEMLKEWPIFETEAAMYTTTIPALEAELRKIGDNTVLGPKMLYHSVGERKCIILEDIVPKGYATLRGRLPNFAETKAALLKLAKWHAVSYKLAAEGDKSTTKYRESFFNMKDIEQMPFMVTGIDNFITLAQKTDDLREYVPKLQALQQKLLRNCINSVNCYREPKRPPGIYVLCHGDFHAKNMMFKWNDKGELEDIMLHDFQISYFGPAVLDVTYGLYMLFDEDLRKNHREELIYYYASNFIDTLERLKFKGDIPKVSDFYIDMFRHRHFETFMLTSFLPIWPAFLTGDVGGDEILASDEIRSKLFDNPAYVNEVKRLLPILFHRGYFE